MEIAIKTVDFAKCGHINVFLEDGRQITLHKRNLYDNVELPPDVEEFLIQMKIMAEVKSIIESNPVSKAVTADKQREIVKSTIEGKGIITCQI